MTLVGYNSSCGKKHSGLTTIGLVPASDIKAVTIDPTGKTCTAITLNAEAKLATYQFKEDEAEYKESVKTENGMYSVEQTLTFKTPDMSPESRAAVDEIIEASYCGVVALIKRVNDTCMIIGWDEMHEGTRPLRLSGAEGTTGKKFTDEQTEEITLSRTGTTKAYYYTGDTAALFSK